MNCPKCGVELIPRFCPDCGAKVDDSMPVSGQEHRHPEPEISVSICLYCSGLSIFTATGLRRMTDAEWKMTMDQEETQRALSVLAFMRSQGKIPPPRWT